MARYFSFAVVLLACFAAFATAQRGTRFANLRQPLVPVPPPVAAPALDGGLFSGLFGLRQPVQVVEKVLISKTPGGKSVSHSTSSFTSSISNSPGSSSEEDGKDKPDSDEDDD